MNLRELEKSIKNRPKLPQYDIYYRRYHEYFEKIEVGFDAFEKELEEQLDSLIELVEPLTIGDRELIRTFKKKLLGKEKPK